MGAGSPVVSDFAVPRAAFGRLHRSDNVLILSDTIRGTMTQVIRGDFARATRPARVVRGRASRAELFVLDPSHVRSRLNDMLAAMRAAKRWPWEQVMVELYRETVWPYLYTRLPDQDEADRWRGEIEAEIARLDAA